MSAETLQLSIPHLDQLAVWLPAKERSIVGSFEGLVLVLDMISHFGLFVE